MVQLILKAIKQFLSGAQKIRCKRRQRSMRVCETLSLGDRRFLALVRVDEQRFLVGAAGNSISLLAQLPSPVDMENSHSGVESSVRFNPEEYKLWK